MEERGGVRYARRELVPIVEDPNIDLEFDSDGEGEDEEDYADRMRIQITDCPFNSLDSDDDEIQVNYFVIKLSVNHFKKLMFY